MVGIEDIRDIPLFAGLDEAQLGWIVSHSTECELKAGDLMFSEGQPADHFFVFLSGAAEITKQVGEELVVLASHTRGVFTGEMPILLDQPYVATSTATEPTHLLQLDVVAFREMLVVCAPVASVMLPALAQRIQQTDMAVQQREKLAGLGKIAAGLAHELNNPAAAGRRASEQLAAALASLQASSFKLSGCDLSEVMQQQLTSLQAAAASHIATALPLDTISQSDQEEQLANWLDDEGFGESWDVAPTFVNAGLEIAQLATVRAGVSSPAFVAAVAWLAASLEVSSLLDVVQKTTGRISELVQAVKSYSYMDQAPVQDVDVNAGLESTLVILGHKLKSIKLVREYERSLPSICAHGGELNQVWTNLLDNAADALAGKGQITIRTRHENECLVVEIEDNGPGIPAEVQANIFDPFFTTKGVGEGTGLGLSIAYRIITQRHQGSISVQSQPGSTCFQIRLPLPDQGG